MYSKLISSLQSLPDSSKSAVKLKGTLGQNNYIYHHPSGSYIKADDNGSLFMNANKSTGLSMSAVNGNVNLYGKHVNIAGSEVRLFTKPDGLVWNGYFLNPDLYKNNTEVLTKDSKYVKILIEAPDLQFDSELNDILKDLGIE